MQEKITNLINMCSYVDITLENAVSLENFQEIVVSKILGGVIRKISKTLT